MLRESLPADLRPFSAEQLKAIRRVVRKKYAEVAVSAAGKFQYLTGREGAAALGYDPVILQELPGELLSAFCGVGNPFSLGTIKPGRALLDIGSGAGLDLIIAGRLTGPNGRVCGVDLTEEMIDRARRNIAELGMGNIEIFHVATETLPFADQTFDVVISNGVINLSPCKQAMFGEIYRVLKPGGTLQFADIVLEKALPAAMVGSLEAWSQ